jgi:hypothetical protein
MYGAIPPLPNSRWKKCGIEREDEGSRKIICRRRKKKKNGLMNGLVITFAGQPLVCGTGMLCALQELGRFMELIKRVYGTQ